MDTTQHITRFQTLKSERSALNNLWVLLERFVVPFKGDPFQELTQDNQVDWRRRDVFDSTGVTSCVNLASSIPAALAQPTTDWFQLTFRDEELNRNREASEWLAAAEKVMLREFKSSAFYAEIPEAFTDLVGFGTMFTATETERQDGEYTGLVFPNVPARDSYFELGDYDRIIRFYRELKWSPSRIIDKFGEENVPSYITDLYESNSCDKVSVLYCAYKVTEPVGPDVILPAEQRPWQACYIDISTGDKMGEPIGYYTAPVTATVWRKVAGSNWGYGPGFLALSDILSLNQLVEDTLGLVSKQTTPPILTTERGLITDYDHSPGGVTVVRSMDEVKEWVSQGDLKAAFLKMEDWRNSIKETFHVNQLELQSGPTMTATEAQIRYELMQRYISPTLGRLESTFLEPTLDRAFDLLYREGQFPPLPDSVISSVGSRTVDVTFVGPLPRMRKQQQVQGYERLVNILNQLGELAPDSGDNLDWDELVYEIATALGVPPRGIRDPKDVKATREERTKQQTEMRQAQMAKDQGAALAGAGAGMKSLKEARDDA